jgi:hypothetical protein
MTNAALMSLLGARFQDDSLSASPGLEGSYRHLFLRELKALGEEDTYFPVGGAANYSLVYLILRISTQLRPASVLDVGCGQSTRLWDRMRRAGLVRQVTTLENDAAWAAQIGPQVSHPILVSELRPMVTVGGMVETYDWGQAKSAGPFDVIGVDGPIGQPRRSRAGVLALLDEGLPRDFVLFMDDAERPGEQETVGLIHDRLSALGRDYAAGVLRAAKTQVVFAAGAYRQAAFY